MDHQIAALLQQGEAAARDGQQAEARRAFRAALVRDPANLAALLWMVWLSEDPHARVAYADRALALDPRNPRARAARRWAESSASFASPEPNSRESLRRRRKIGWSRLIPATALGSVGAFFAGMFLVLIWYAPQGIPIVPASDATPSPTRTKAATLGPSSTPTPSASAVTTPVDTAAPTATDTPTPIPTPSLSPTSPPTVTPRPSRSSPLSTPDGMSPTRPSISDDVRWIDVDLTRQTLTAYEGQTAVRTTLVSTGLPRTPTPVGQYYIYIKFLKDDMRGPDYYLRDVPYTMYFYRGYGLHGTYWHSNFGQPMSHGCINLPTEEAKWLFDWASVGTLVKIHR